MNVRALSVGIFSSQGIEAQGCSRETVCSGRDSSHLLHRSCVSMPCAAGRKKPRLCRMLTPQLNTSCSRAHRTDRRRGKYQQGKEKHG